MITITLHGELVVLRRGDAALAVPRAEAPALLAALPRSSGARRAAPAVARPAAPGPAVGERAPPPGGGGVMPARTRPTSGLGRQPDTQDRGQDRAATIVAWAQRLMITRGYGWSKAISAARDLYGESNERNDHG